MASSPTSEPLTIDAARLTAMRASGAEARLLDVRTPGEFETLHIPGSYNVPLDQLGEHRDEIRRMSQQVVIVCQSGSRASQAGRKLAAAGMGNVSVLAGGMNAWLAAGGDVNGGGQRWSLERQVRLVAGLIVLTSVLASLAVPALVAVAGFIGAGLAFAALTDTCAMGMLLGRLPYNRGTAACDVDAMVAQLTAPPKSRAA